MARFANSLGGDIPASRPRIALQSSRTMLSACSCEVSLPCGPHGCPSSGWWGIATKRVREACLSDWQCPASPTPRTAQAFAYAVFQLRANMRSQRLLLGHRCRVVPAAAQRLREADERVARVARGDDRERLRL